MRAGPGGWDEGCGGIGALPPPATPDPAGIAERALPAPPIPFADQVRAAPEVLVFGPPPPNPCGPGASEPPVGPGAGKLEHPTSPAPVRCPNPPEARETRSMERLSHAPSHYRRPPLTPRQPLHLPERADKPQAGTQTDTQTLAHTHAKGDSWPAQAPQPEPEHLGEAGGRRTGRRLAVRRYRGRNT